MTGHVEQVRRLEPLRDLLGGPAEACFAEARLFPVADVGPESGRPVVLGYYRAGRLASALMLGANLVPIATDDESRAALVSALVRSGRRCSSIVGPADQVLPLWERLEPYWGRAREVRPVQPLLSIGGPPLAPVDPSVRPVPIDRLDDYLPASVAMFTEEVGVDPRAGGMAKLYRDRVADLLRAGRAFARWQDDRVLFKAELGAVTRRAAQVQGVWVDPAWRGRGHGVAGVAAVVAHGLRIAPIVTLYVNSFNAPALAVYRRVGFQRVGTFATVLF